MICADATQKIPESSSERLASLPAILSRNIIGQDWTDIDGEMEWRVPSDAPHVFANRQGLMQTMLNLSQNSLRAVADAGAKRLIIETVHKERQVQLRVTDSGPGLKTEKDLFQPFRKEADGSGLGLYVSRALIESFGGELRYEPTGTGCCFVITLRAAGDEVATNALDDGAEAEQTNI